MEPAAITPVAAWQARLGYTDREAAAKLGMSLPGYQRNKWGRNQAGEEIQSSTAFLLACAAIENGLQPIG